MRELSSQDTVDIGIACAVAPELLLHGNNSPAIVVATLGRRPKIPDARRSRRTSAGRALEQSTNRSAAIRLRLRMSNAEPARPAVSLIYRAGRKASRVDGLVRLPPGGAASKYAPNSTVYQLVYRRNHCSGQRASLASRPPEMAAQMKRSKYEPCCRQRACKIRSHSRSHNGVGKLARACLLP